MLHSHTQFVYATDVARARARSLTHTTKTKEKSINRAWNPVCRALYSILSRETKVHTGPAPAAEPAVSSYVLLCASRVGMPHRERNSDVTLTAPRYTDMPGRYARTIHRPRAYTSYTHTPEYEQLAPRRAGIGHASMSHELKEPLLCLERRSSPSRTFSYSRSSLHQTRSSHSMEWKRGGR